MSNIIYCLKRLFGAEHPLKKLFFCQTIQNTSAANYQRELV